LNKRSYSSGIVNVISGGFSLSIINSVPAGTDCSNIACKFVCLVISIYVLFVITPSFPAFFCFNLSYFFYLPFLFLFFLYSYGSWW